MPRKRPKAAPKLIARIRAPDRPPFSTNLSQRVLFALKTLGSSDLKGILEAVGEPKGVTIGTIWTVLDRARSNGLVNRVRTQQGLTYELSRGGERRVKWLKTQSR